MEIHYVLSKDKKALRSRAHALKPVIITGQAGISDAVLAETEIALEHHELIKVRVRCDDKEERAQMIKTICDHTSAELVQSIGQVITLYRKRAEK